MDFFRKYKLSEIAEMLNAKIIGDENLMVSGINEIHKVKINELAFVDHPKYYKKVIESEASAIIINTEVKSSKPLLVCEDPIAAFNQLIDFFMPKEFPTASIGKGCKIAESAQIYPGAIIGNGVEIGENTILYPNVVIYDFCKIGSNVRIHSNTTIGGDAFYFNKRNEGYFKLKSGGKVIIEDAVEIGCNCTIDKGVSGITRIGAGTKIDNLVQIAHGVVIGKNCLIAAQVGIAGKTIVGDNVKIWGQVGIIASIKIGDNVEIYAQSGVAKDLEANKKYFGSPADEARKQMRLLAKLKNL